MALIDNVRETCEALAPAGWRDLLLDVTSGALDLQAADLAAELGKELDTIDRTAPGFEDFAPQGHRAIEPGVPAQSLLYHALASPLVQTHKGDVLGAFPSPAQIESVENYVYGASPPALGGLVAPGDEAGIVVFALEYRPAARTPHGRYADLCFSRTGVSRVGTAPASYDERTRQWEPLDLDDPFAFRVVPVRFAPFIAILRNGERGVVPDRFMPGDETRSFWVPVHKLFDGSECIDGLSLELAWSSWHVNEKLSRLHGFLEAHGYDTGWSGAVLDQPPFRFTDGIAELSTEPSGGVGILVPTVHDALVDAATFDGKPLAMTVPKELKAARSHSHLLARYFSGLEVAPVGPLPLASNDQMLRPAGRSHHAPEIVNVRHELLEDGSEVNLNDRPDVWDIVAAGGYQALHYLDFAGDGWVGVSCAAVAQQIPVHRAAYSIVCAPDFFPYCDPLQLTEWTATLPEVIRYGLWAVLPRPLSDSRFAANQTLDGSGFAPPEGAGLTDTTATAIVCQAAQVDGEPPPWPEPGVLLRTSLPDGASGVFDPGWDITTDSTAKQAGISDLFLVGYGLGTPFVEDMKICAALGTYWPAAAPDSTRTFQPDKYWPTISPLTDEEIGIVGDLPWDGVKGPIRVDEQTVQYTDIDYADYVDQALDHKLTAALTSRIDFDEYCRRVLAMAWVYWALGLRLQPKTVNGKEISFFQRLQNFLLAKAEWNVLSFRVVAPDDPGLAAALAATGSHIQGSHVYGGSIFRHGADTDGPTFTLRHVEIVEEAEFYTDLSTVLVARAGAAWQADAIPTS